MQKENSVIKNYILSPDKYLLLDKTTCPVTEISLYHLLSKQNKAEFLSVLSVFLLRK